MKLRNNCTDHTRISRRALRLALAFALAAGSCSSLQAADLIPAANRPLQGNGAAEPELLPYPFGKTDGRKSGEEESTAAARAGVSRQMVKLLGLARPKQMDETLSNQRAPDLSKPSQSLPSFALPIAPTLPLVAGVVVTASATEASAPKTPEALPALPASPPAPGLSESLLDIEIPASLAMMPSMVEEKVSDKNSGMASSKDGLKGEQGAASATGTESLSGVIQACEPPALNPSEAVATKTTVAPKMAGPGNISAMGRQPDIVRSPQAMNLSVKSPAAPKSSGAVSLNLNDSPTDSKAMPLVKASGAPSVESRGAALHLSSASEEVKLTAPVATPVASTKLSAKTSSALPPRKAEQQSRPVVEKLSDSTSGGLRPAHPLSMLDRNPNSLQARLAPTGKTLGPVQAVLATRTTPVMDSQSRVKQSSSVSPAISAVETYPAEPVARASSDALAVGLQESHTLSTDYTILELSVEHPDVCQLLKTSDRSVSIIGMRPGATRIALISYDSQGERKVDVREIAVGDRAATAINLPELAKEISQTVARMYPMSDVQILADQDQIVVRGYTNYEHDAKKILALIRKTSLAPVVDQLTTSGN